MTLPEKQLIFDFDTTEAIETIVITPTKEIPLKVFKQLHHLAYFMELMERLPDGKILWNPKTVSIYSEDLAEAEYLALQKDWIHCDMEIPKIVYKRFVPFEANK